MSFGVIGALILAYHYNTKDINLFTKIYTKFYMTIYVIYF